MHPDRSFRGALALSVAALNLFSAETLSSPNVRTALDRISAASMRGHVSFLASDLLEGRGTPSRGQDIAAEYIAAQFRRAGLEPVGDDSFYQKASFLSLEPNKEGAVLEMASGDRKASATADQLSLNVVKDIALSGAAVVKVAADPAEVAKLRREDVADKVVAVYVTRGFGPEAEKRYEALSAIRKLKPALMILAGPGSPRQQRGRLLAADEVNEQVPSVGLREGDLVKEIESAAPGLLAWKVEAKLPAAKQKPLTLRNIAGLIRGSDPILKDTYLLVTAHYDHVGMKSEGDGDRIYNGANDDASGVASLLEIAGTLNAMNPRPRRSILFVALFGEEAGLLGSEYYGRHPLVPLRNTVGDINLEHMGRTDATDGVKIGSASFTGFDYSDLPAIFKTAGEHMGVSVYKDEKLSDPFFARSDNQALADVGIPAHTICVAFEFPDYHAVGDEWQKLDYDNMAKIDRMVTLGLITIADSETAPKWNEQEPKAQKYAAAWRTLHAESGQ